MIIPAILYTFKGKLLLGLSALFATIAVTEGFFGNLVIAVIVAIIGATPPTVAIVLMSRKQSYERKAAHKEVIDNQTKMKEDLDGKLDRLSNAEKGQALAEGKLEGAAAEQARTTTEPVHEPDKVHKMEIVNEDDKAIPTRPVKPAK